MWCVGYRKNFPHVCAVYMWAEGVVDGTKQDVEGLEGREGEEGDEDLIRSEDMYGSYVSTSAAIRRWLSSARDRCRRAGFQETVGQEIHSVHRRVRWECCSENSVVRVRFR